MSSIYEEIIKRIDSLAVEIAALKITEGAGTAGGSISGSGITGRITEWTGVSSQGSSTLIKTGVGVLTLASDTDYTLTVAGTASISGTNTGDSASISTGLLTTRGDIIRRGASVPERYGLVVPAAGTINYLGVANGEVDPTYKSASSNPGAAASLLASDANGYLALTRLGIGIVPTVGLQMYGAGGANPTFYIGNSTTAQPFSAIIADTTVAGAISLASASAGGLFLQGLADSDGPAFVFRGLIGSTAPTIPAVQFRASKWNGTTSVANLAAGETGFLFTNSSATQEHLRIMGNGYVGIGIAAPAAKLHVVGTTDVQQLIVKNNATQTTNPIELHPSGSTTALMYVTPTGGAVFNDGGDAAGDVRMESDTEVNMFLLDANGNTDGTIYLGGSTNGIQIDKGGDSYWIGTGAGLPYGSFYGLEIAQTQAAAQNTWYAINDADITDGPTNLVTGDGAGKLTVTKAGTYLINYAVTLEATANNTHYSIGVGINGTVQNQGQQHKETDNSNREFIISGTAILALTASQYVQLFFRTIGTGTPTITLDDVNFTMVMVGS